jgi:hypothetical protein
MLSHHGHPSTARPRDNITQVNPFCLIQLFDIMTHHAVGDARKNACIDNGGDSFLGSSIAAG